MKKSSDWTIAATFELVLQKNSRASYMVHFIMRATDARRKNLSVIIQGTRSFAILEFGYISSRFVVVDFHMNVRGY
jgi:hypothetical protein